MPRSSAFARAVLVAGSLLACAAAVAPAQGTAVVPAADPVYADVDRLLLLGLLDSVIVGQRPYSGRELGRLLGIARRRAAESPASATGLALRDAALDRIAARIGLDAAATRSPLELFDEVQVTATSTDARRRPLLGEGLAEATIDPLASRRLGATAPRGQSVALELAQRAEPLPWLAVQARERFAAGGTPEAGRDPGHAELLRASVRARYRNLALTAGREQVTWAQRAGDGLMLASDAPALDQLSLASDQPFSLPGRLRGLGVLKGTLLLADLGPSVVRSHAKLLAYKLSIAPSPTIELGASFENQFGGSGARQSSALDHVIDFLPFIDIFRTHNYGDTTRTLDVESDKVIGLDGRLTLRRLGGVVLAGEWILDDFDVSRLTALFTNDGSQSLAVLIPRIGSSRVALELSAKHMGVFSYTHTPRRNGMTTHGRLLGDELGNDSKAFGATLRVQARAETRVDLDLRTSIHSDVVYSPYSANVGVFDPHKVTSAPDELRDRLLVGVLHQPLRGLRLQARAGAERIRNARYVGPRRSYVAEVGVAVTR